MGNEALCTIDVDGSSAEAKALLETDELLLRAPLRMKIPFAEMRDVAAGDGILRFLWTTHRLALTLGPDAEKWAETIRNPKSVLDKLGVKAGQKVSVVGPADEAFVAELEKRGADVSRRARKGSDIIFYCIARREELPKLATLRESLVPNGGIWVVRPKGTPAITDTDVIAAGKAAGLVDVKVVRFSATHTAEKLVIPLAKRSL